MGEQKTKRIAVGDVVEGLGKIPPQAIELEETVLGAAMLERDAATTLLEHLKAEDFYKDANKSIFEAIEDLFNNNDPIDLKTVTHQLRRNGTLELVGGAYYISQLSTKVNSGSNIEAHAFIIKEQSLKRQIIRICGEGQNDAYEDTEDVFRLLDKIDNQISNLFNNTTDVTHIGSTEFVKIMMEEIEETIEKSRKGNTIGISTGIPKVDSYTGGLHNGDLLIVAGRPGMGKTAYIVSLVRHISIECQIPCAIFSLEMTTKQITARFISQLTEIDVDKFRNGRIEDFELEQLVDKMGKLSGAPIYINDTTTLTINQIKAKARALVKNNDVKLILVDYLQLVNGVDERMQREQQIAQVSRGLKALAKDMEIPVIALSQLSRTVESRGGEKRPMLSDLRESGAIEQDADVVQFLYRPEYYHIWEAKVNGVVMSTRGLGEIIYAKNRHGKLGSEFCKFVGKFVLWEELEGSDPVAVTPYNTDDVRDPTESGQKDNQENDDDLPF